MSTETRSHDFREVTQADPCRICEKPDWCRRSDDGAHECHRITDENVNGFTRIHETVSGFGLYREDIFFGIIAKGRLYFKTSKATVSDYIEWDMNPFQPNSKQTLKNYYEVPPEILEDEDQLAVWARKAVGSLS